MNKLRECPRCKRRCLEDEDVLNSQSHKWKDVYICPTCGQMEGLVKLGSKVPESEILLSEEFEKWGKENWGNKK